MLLLHCSTVFVLVTQKPLPFAVSDVRVASVTGHKERASGVYVGGRIAYFHGLVCWGEVVCPPKLKFFKKEAECLSRDVELVYF